MKKREMRQRNHERPERNPVGGEVTAGQKRPGRLCDGCGENNPEEDEGEENTAGNRRRTTRDPVGGSNGREHENFPTSVPRTLGIQRGVAGRLTKQPNKLSEEINAPRSGTTAQ